MKTSIVSILNLIKIVVLSLVCVLFFSFLAAAEQAVMKEIRVIDDPLSLELSVSKFIPVKIIQVEKKELVIALKGIRLDPGFKISGKRGTQIKNVAVEKLQGNVLAVVLTNARPFSKFTSGFDASNSNFIVRFEKQKFSPEAKLTPLPEKGFSKADGIKEPPPSKPLKIQEKAAKQTVPTQPKPSQAIERTSSAKPEKKIPGAKTEQSSSIPKPVVYVPPERERSRFKGDLSDIIKVADDSSCNSPEIANALLMLSKKRYNEAFIILDQYLAQDSFACLEEAYYLRGYAFYRQVDEENFTQLIKAEELFQDALVSYPVSVYVPYGYTAIGMIQKKLKNLSAAEGYFTIVKQGYLAYTGMPEIMYHLADIYAQKGYLDKALRYYKQVFEDTSVNSYIADAGIGYGKALFQKKQYLDALSILNYVVESEPRKVYDSNEVLLYIGNANYEVGQSQAARIALTRVLNLFRDIDGPDIILNRIGDTYGMENNKEKAIKIYELVRERYPDTQGFVASSIGLARYMDSDKEKIEIYTMIKNKYPDNTYARIAMMRLAEIHQANKEYNKCINQIIELLSTQPRGLRYEAVKLMQKAYEALFEKQLKSGEYTKVLNRYELDHTRIDRMSSRKISLIVGQAYLEGKLTEEAFNHLITAYKQYKRSERSAELLFGLGVAMDDSGRDEDALKLFNAFAKRFPKHKNLEDVLIRTGAIYLDKTKYKLASQKLNHALKVAKNQLNKGRILILNSIVFEKKGDLDTASRYRERAVKELALASGENYDILTRAYKELGGVYTRLKLYVKAADAYVKAMSLSDDDGEKANLGFLLGDAYQKGNILPEARKAYQQVAQTYDSVWARMAQQRLDTLDLADSVQNS